MIAGVDVSGWQTVAEFKAHWNPSMFAMIKATEGVGFKSDRLDPIYSVVAEGSPTIQAKDRLYGFYHYGRPDLGNSPEAEAKWFLDTVGHHKGYAFFALDWEGEALHTAADWPIKWLAYVKKETGFNPLFYINQSTENSGVYNAVHKNGYPLWLAAWVEKPQLKYWSSWCIWQYKDKPIDSDWFDGTVEDWHKLCKGESLSHDLWKLTEQSDRRIVFERC